MDTRRSHPGRDNQGRPQYRLGVWTDISIRKKAEEEQTNLIGMMTKRTIQLQTAAEVAGRLLHSGYQEFTPSRCRADP